MTATTPQEFPAQTRRERLAARRRAVSPSRLRPRRGRWPSRRRGLAPEGYCDHCWREGGPPVAGKPFVWGYPSTLPPGQGAVLYYCEAHADEERRINISLIPLGPEPAVPVPSPLRQVVALLVASGFLERRHAKVLLAAAEGGTDTVREVLEALPWAWAALNQRPGPNGPGEYGRLQLVRGDAG